MFMPQLAFERCQKSLFAFVSQVQKRSHWSIWCVDIFLPIFCWLYCLDHCQYLASTHDLVSTSLTSIPTLFSAS